MRKFDNTFEILEQPSKIKVYKKMKVCKSCLKKLNYKNYNNVSKEEREKIVDNFSFEEFFSKYDSNFMYIPKNLTKEYEEFNSEYEMAYAENWKEISREFREYKHWICDKCGKDMSNDKYNLHVHHKDHNKANNSYSNLMCLCRECHSNMPGHEHMKK